jgi:hypothetical protein
MYDYELQKFAQLAVDIGVHTTDVSPLVYHQDRQQKRFSFNLDWNKPLERSIGQGLLQHKRERNMVGVIRDAVRLYFDLSAGRTDVLCELFPWVMASLPQGRALTESSPIISTHKLTEKPGPRPLTIPSAAQPDDDLPALVMRKAEADGESGRNFLSRAFGLLGD